jgi:predicted DNA-binding transcriptional regulator AlpA
MIALIGSSAVSTTEITKSHRKSARAADKAAEPKTTNEPKRKQHPWLRAPGIEPPKREHASDRSQGPTPLLSKAEVCALVGASFPTVWEMMRAGTFPRSRIFGGKSMWLSSELEDWMQALPLRRLKGDPPPSEVA